MSQLGHGHWEITATTLFLMTPIVKSWGVTPLEVGTALLPILEAYHVGKRKEVDLKL